MNTITLTSNAIEHLKKKISAQGHGKGLLIGIKRTGCSGYAYDLSIVDEAPEGAEIYQQLDGLFIAVTKENLPFVVGSTIDYVRDGLNAHFKFINPNEAGTCGCGESFTVEKNND